MAKRETVQYVCSNCGAASATWSGRCYNCGEWNTLQEQLNITGSSVKSGKRLTPQSVTASLAKDQPRFKTTVTDVDTVFGGGIVAGSVNLIAGQPGIGKSTLLLQLANNLAKTHNVL